MFAALNRYRYRLFLIILGLFLIVILLWMHFSNLGKKAPSRGVFVLDGASGNFKEKECGKIAEGNVKG